MNTTKNEKALAGRNRKGFVNPMINFDGNQRLISADYSGKALEKQLLSSGASEKLADDLTAHLIKPRRVVKCVRCAGCGKPHAPNKMSVLYPICRICLTETREKGIRAQSNFINRAVNNFQIYLKGALVSV
jgi:ribosomal protein S14